MGGCGRDNPLNIPPNYVAPIAPFCTDENPYEFELLSDISINGKDSSSSFNFNTFNYSINFVSNKKNNSNKKNSLLNKFHNFNFYIPISKSFLNNKI